MNLKQPARWGCLFIAGCLIGFVTAFSCCRYILHLVRRSY